MALITNIEGREWHRREVMNGDRNQEHPRASTADDVECFFSMMRDNIGLNFTTKQVKFNVRKVYGEFTKRLDPDLPFYCYTSAHSRFYCIIPIIYNHYTYALSGTTAEICQVLILQNHESRRKSLGESNQVPLHLVVPLCLLEEVWLLGQFALRTSSTLPICWTILTSNAMLLLTVTIYMYIIKPYLVLVHLITAGGHFPEMFIPA